MSTKNTTANTPTSGRNAGKGFTVANVIGNTFDLAGIVCNGNYAGGGQWTRGPVPVINFPGKDIDGVFWRVKCDDRNAGFQGALLSGPGVPPKAQVRVLQLGDNKKGQLALSKPLTKDDGKTPLPYGINYKWTLSGN